MDVCDNTCMHVHVHVDHVRDNTCIDHGIVISAFT